jgi:transcriptional regulator with XRE-family HTH domain
MVMTSNERQIAGDNIRRLCERDKLSLSQFAKDIDLDRTWLHDILNGEANATFDTYERIAGYFGITVRELLTEPRRGRELARR